MHSYITVFHISPTKKVTKNKLKKLKRRKQKSDVSLAQIITYKRWKQTRFAFPREYFSRSSALFRRIMRLASSSWQLAVRLKYCARVNETALRERASEGDWKAVGSPSMRASKINTTASSWYSQPFRCCSKSTRADRKVRALFSHSELSLLSIRDQVKRERGKERAPRKRAKKRLDTWFRWGVFAGALFRVLSQSTCNLFFSLKGSVRHSGGAHRGLLSARANGGRERGQIAALTFEATRESWRYSVTHLFSCEFIFPPLSFSLSPSRVWVALAAASPPD